MPGLSAGHFLGIPSLVPPPGAAKKCPAESDICERGVVISERDFLREQKIPWFEEFVWWVVASITSYHHDKTTFSQFRRK
jgi:hypothetical protein